VSSEQQQAFNQQRRDQYHHTNLQGGGRQEPAESAQILAYLSQIDDLPVDPQTDDVMGQLVSKLTSTANLTTEEVRSNEWWREIILTLWLCMSPETDGVHGAERAFVTGDETAAVAPIDAETRIQMEASVGMGKLALSRSEDFTAVTEGTRNISESIVHDEDGNSSGSGGILGRLTG
jgi:hypothetical protein